MLSTVAEGVSLSIHRSSIVIQDSIVAFHLSPYPSMCVQCIFTYLFQSVSLDSFIAFHITLPSSTISLYDYIISCDDSSILVYFNFLVLQS